MSDDVIAVVAVAAAMLLLAALCWLALRAYRYISEGASVYSGPIDAERARFLYATFGVSEAHMRALHFDGRFFHVGQRAVPYSEVDALSCSAPRQVRVSNPRVAHTALWRHQRRDGGPDGRYAKNPKTMLSTRYIVSLKGARSGRIVIYDDGTLAQTNSDDAFAELTKPLWSLFGDGRLSALPPARDVQEIVARFDQFVRLAKVHDLEASLTKYTAAVRELAARQQEYYATLARKGQADGAAEAAYRRRAAGSARGGQDLYDRAIADQQALADALDRISRSVAEARSAWIAVVQEVRDVRALQAYATQR